MEILKNIRTRFLFSLSLILAATISFAQKNNKATIENAVNTKQFIFKAQSVLPMAGPTRYLTSDYEVKVLGDSLVSYLPYFGRAYSVTYGERGGIDFTSTKFDYKAKPAKKGWDVSIQPKDAKDVQRFSFNILENGTAYLQVTSTNRQPISFTGYIVEKK